MDGLNLNASYYEKKKIAVADGKKQTYETGSTVLTILSEIYLLDMVKHL